MITESLMKGGKERRLLELLRYFDEVGGVEVLLILLKDVIDYPIASTLKNTEIIVLKRKIKKDPTIFFQVAKLSKSFKPDLIHSWGAMPSMYISPVAYFQHIPLLNAMVADCNFPFLGTTWRRAKFTYPFSAYVLSNSYAGLKAYEVPYEKGFVIYNGVHLDRFKIEKTPEEIRNKLGIKTKYVVGKVAAFHPRKDYETYIKAAVEIVSGRDDVTFVSIGEGVLLEKMKNIVPQKYKEKILFLGKLDYVEEIINIFDIGVLAGFAEGISNSIIEYMAMGKPVVANCNGGNPEIVDNNFNGYVVPTLNLEEMIDKIQILLDDPEKRLRFGKNGMHKIKEGFTIKLMADSYFNLYHSILKKAKRI